MPLVTVPGSDRAIWVDLHEPIESSLPWFANVGRKENLTPEQFASMEINGFTQTVHVLQLDRPNREDLAAMARSAAAHEMARRKLIRGRSGRPRSTAGFSKWEDFAVIVLYFESLGYKQPIRRALDYWPQEKMKSKEGNDNRCRMPRRQLESALRAARRWLITDLFRAADVARKRWDLPPIGTALATRKRNRLN